MVEKRLAKIGARLRELREETAAVDEQIVFWAEQTSELETRGIVSGNPYDQRDAEEARRTLDNNRRHRDRLAAEIARLQAEADALLDSMTKD